MKTYRVSIVFSDGEYSNDVMALSVAGAIHLVTMDARMATPHHPQFHGDVQSVHAEVIE